MTRRFRNFIMLWAAIFTLLCCTSAQALALSELFDMSEYDDAIREEVEWNEEMLLEVDSWKAGASRLDEEEYSWAAQARALIVQYFSDVHEIDLTEQVGAIGIYASDLPEMLAGFHDGTGDVYISRADLEQDSMLHVCVHEMLHALGIDFFFDESGLVSNGLYEGLTEAVTAKLFEQYNLEYADISAYSEVMGIAQTMLEGDSALPIDIVAEDKCDIAARIDAALGEGFGEAFLKSAMLIADGEMDEQILNNARTIASAYSAALAGV